MMIYIIIGAAVLGSIADLAAVMAIFALLRDARVNFMVVEAQTTIATGTLIYGLTDVRAYAKVKAAPEYRLMTEKASMPNTKDEKVESSFSFSEWRKVYTITFSV